MTKPSVCIAKKELEAIVKNEVEMAGLSVEVAEALAELSVAAICSVLAGSQVYFPRRLLNEYRDRAIYRLANGLNGAELAEINEISDRQVRNIVARGRRAKGKI
jgi:Mor family transcriptional regulator